MSKLLLLSVLVATMAVPTLAARGGGARKGLARALGVLAVVVVVYWLGVLGWKTNGGE